MPWNLNPGTEHLIGLQVDDGAHEVPWLADLGLTLGIGVVALVFAWILLGGLASALGWAARRLWNREE